VSDPVEELVSKIQSRADIWLTKFSSNALNSVAEVFERDGFGATRVYLLDKQQRDDDRDRQQATSLLAVLDLMHDCAPIQQRRAIGRLVFKALGSLRPEGQPETPREQSADTNMPKGQSAYPSTPRGQSRHPNTSRGSRR
jgi:hypothetical protein